LYGNDNFRPMTLETERLVLRKPELGDRDGYAQMWGDPEVVRFLSGMTRRPDRVVKGIERMLRHWERHGLGLLSVIRKADERLIGRTGYLLWDKQRWTSAMHEEIEGDDLELEIGWAFARGVWNQGFATEAAIACRDHAFGQLGWSRVVSLIAEKNIASIRVAQKIGETLERENIPGPFKEKVDLYALGNRGAASSVKTS
jgi:RimJ/RimL family protein N-acetyltransferase